MDAPEVKYWLLRMKTPHDLTDKAWGLGMMGVWHGNYSVADFEHALETDDPAGYLSRVNRERGTLWDVGAGNVRTVKRFLEIKEQDWVFMYSSTNGRLYAARLDTKAISDDENTFGLNSDDGDRLKFRQIVDRRVFELASLPDSFLLLPNVGRGTVESIQRARRSAQVLAESKDEAEVWERLRAMSLADWLEVMGPMAWESLCEAWLILTKTFVPTGLRTGRTLRDLDIAGVRFDTGARVVAQCKKDPAPGPVAKSFVNFVRRARMKGGASLEAYYFAYGGRYLTPEDHQLGIQVCDRDMITNWLTDDDSGKKFRQLLRRE